jgi:hypothetical protein
VALGHRAGAAAAYRCALALDPGADWARANLARLGDAVPPSTHDCAAGPKVQRP